MFHTPAHKQPASLPAFRPVARAQAVAVFHMDAARMRSLIEAMNARTGCDVEVSVRGGSSLAEVSGLRQDVMTVVGEIAAQGEDCLESFDTL